MNLNRAVKFLSWLSTLSGSFMISWRNLQILISRAILFIHKVSKIINLFKLCQMHYSMVLLFTMQLAFVISQFIVYFAYRAFDFNSVS